MGKDIQSLHPAEQIGVALQRCRDAVPVRSIEYRAQLRILAMHRKFRRRIQRLIEGEQAERSMFRMIWCAANIVVKGDNAFQRLAYHSGDGNRAGGLLHQRMRNTIMARDQHRPTINAIVIGECRGQPCLSAMFRHKVGMKKSAITEGVFQHAVDSGAAGAGKMKKA